MEIINLSSGAAYFQTPEIVRKAAMEAIEAGYTSYGPTEGLPVLRQAISDRYHKLNKITISPERILVTAGAKQALFNLFSTLLQPGDEVIVPVANWFGFHELLEQVQAKLVIVPTSPEDNYTIHPENVAAVITDKTRLFILCNPGNPTGRIYSETDIAALLAVLNNYPGILVLSDEIYDLVTYGDRVPSLLEFPDEYNRFIVVNGFSKSFAMSGWRVGYLVVPEKYFAACYKFQENTISGVSPFSQVAAAVALQNQAQVLNPMNAILKNNRDWICSNVSEIKNISFHTPQATYYIFPDIRAYLGKTTESGLSIHTAIDFSNYLKEQYQLQIWAGDYFGAPGFARISFAVESAQLQEAFNRFRTALWALKWRKL